jgi:hypothetical protein
MDDIVNFVTSSMIWLPACPTSVPGSFSEDKRLEPHFRNALKADIGAGKLAKVPQVEVETPRDARSVCPEGGQGELAGGSGKDQPAINRRAASALPAITKYLAMGTADSSRDLSNPGEPMTATSDHTHAARQIDWG